MKYTLYFLAFFLFQSCKNHGQLRYIDQLPKKLSETSGMAQFAPESAWLIEDSGNSDNLYKIDFKGNIIKHLDIKNQKNIDWEDLTKDKKGNLYIGDFGNNENLRKNLAILKMTNPEVEKGDKIDVEVIKFNYPEQQEFPPKREDLVYDAEAFFHFDNHLYIFTKNRANPFTGETFVYKVQDQKGSYEAEFLGKIKLCSDWNTCKVTSADISPDGKKIVLLGYGKIWLLTNFYSGDISKVIIKEIDLEIRTQLESIFFTDNKTLLLSDEVRDGSGGNLYSYTLD